MDLPIYNEQKKLADEGIAIVKDIVEKQLNCLFRKISLDDDYGLDGYIDILKEGKYITGKSIGVQIKTGKSYFKNTTNSGWIFYGENKHINYYLNNNIPIIIVLIDPETKSAYWSHITSNSIIKTDSNWKITINQKSLLTNKESLLSIAGKFIDYTPQLEYMALINEKMFDSGLIFIAIDREEVENLDLEAIISLLKWLTSSDEMIFKCRNKLLLTVFGYDEDPRELYEIDSVRKWMRNALTEFKYWAYFMSMTEEIRRHSTIKILLACNIKIKILKRDSYKKVLDVEYNFDDVKDFKAKLFNWLNEFAALHNIEEKWIFEQSMLVLQTIDNLSNAEVKQLRTQYGFDQQ